MLLEVNLDEPMCKVQ